MYVLSWLGKKIYRNTGYNCFVALEVFYYTVLENYFFTHTLLHVIRLFEEMLAGDHFFVEFYLKASQVFIIYFLLFIQKSIAYK